MGLVLVVTFGLILWIVAWAVGGIGGADPFVLTLVVILLGAGGRMLIPYLPGRG